MTLQGGASVDNFLNTQEAAERLGVHSRTVVRWIEQGHFPGARKVNPFAKKRSPYIIPLSDIEQFEKTRDKGIEPKE
jgi:hypothetical protein